VTWVVLLPAWRRSLVGEEERVRGEGERRRERAGVEMRSGGRERSRGEDKGSWAVVGELRWVSWAVNEPFFSFSPFHDHFSSFFLFFK
jgi:hypothetical protein